MNRITFRFGCYQGLRDTGRAVQLALGDGPGWVLTPAPETNRFEYGNISAAELKSWLDADEAGTEREQPAIGLSLAPS